MVDNTSNSVAELMYSIFNNIITNESNVISGDIVPDEAYFEGGKEFLSDSSIILTYTQLFETPMDSKSATDYFKKLYPKITKVDIDVSEQGEDLAEKDGCYQSYVMFYVGENLLEFTVQWKMEYLGDGNHKLTPYKWNFFNEVCIDKNLWKKDTHALIDFFI